MPRYDIDTHIYSRDPYFTKKKNEVGNSNATYMKAILKYHGIMAFTRSFISAVFVLFLLN